MIGDETKGRVLREEWAVGDSNTTSNIGVV
jgi:hypothetical protein